jgi:hypothetical protein
MKLLITIFLIITTIPALGQITFDELMSLENKTFTEIQAFFAKEYTIIDDSKEYKYFPLQECNPPQFADDNCLWSCAKPNYLDAIISKYPIDKIQFKNSSNKNYEVWLNLNSTFAENYDFNTKKANTFIELSERKSWANDNCNNQLISGRGIGIPINIKIQFSNPDRWKIFKKSVAENATFQETYRFSDNGHIELRYGIRRKFINEIWNGVYIILYEENSTYHVNISFESYGVK